jgi:hypothetical protein
MESKMIYTKKQNNELVIWHQIRVRRPVASVLRITPILLLIIALFCIIPVSADLIDNKTYYSDITPQNNLYELAVHPGDYILQGRSYDLTHVYGFTGTFAHWNNYLNQGLDCFPDYTVETNYITTNTQKNPKNIYIDPILWPRGDWLQWEGCYERYDNGKDTGTSSPYLNDNNVMFKVINYYQDVPIIKHWEAVKEGAPENFTTITAIPTFNIFITPIPTSTPSTTNPVPTRTTAITTIPPTIIMTAIPTQTTHP